MKPWMTPIIKYLLNKKWRAYRSKKFIIFRAFQDKLKREICKAKTNWTRNFLDIKDNKGQNGHWDIYKKLFRNKVSKLDLLINRFGNLTNTCNGIGEYFANELKATNNTINSNIYSNSSVNYSEDPLIIDTNLISQKINKLKTNKATGSDDMLTKIIKLCMPYIVEPLAHIFNSSINNSIYPSKWKHASIIPIPKKDNPEIKDLRPISLLPIFSKLLEQIIYDLLLKKHKIVHLFGLNQHGFRPQSSTTTALIMIHDYITQYMDQSNCYGVLVIAIDMSKAFDQVDHDKLVQILSHKPIPVYLIKWIQNYIANRSFQIQIQNTLSTKFHKNVGMAQGSIPCLFNIYIADILIPENINNTKLVKYADDITAIAKICKGEQVETKLQSIIFHLQTQINNLHLQINLTKTQAMFIPNARLTEERMFNDTSYSHTSALKILGVTFNSKLTWQQHIDTVCKKAASRFFILRSLRRFIPADKLLVLYYGLVRSILEYAAPLFTSLTCKEKRYLDGIQKRALNIIFGYNEHHPTLENLSDRRLNMAIKLFKKAEDNMEHILHCQIPDRLTNSNHLRQQFCRTERRQHSFFPYMTTIMNEREQKKKNE